MKSSTVSIAGLLLAAALGAFAQTSAGAPAASTAGTADPVRIAVINFQAAVSATNEFQRNYGDLQKKYDPKRQALKTLNDDIETLRKQLQTQGDTLNDSERETRTRTLNDKEKQLQREQEDAQNDFQQDLQDTFNGVASKVGDVLVNYAQQHGYSLVLDGGNPQAQTVLYAAQSTDITKAIIDAYNTKSGVPAPPTQLAVPPGAQAAPRTPRAPAQHPPAQPQH